MNGSHTWLKMWLWGTWKGIGWSAIIYIAGISGIDQQLYVQQQLTAQDVFSVCGTSPCRVLFRLFVYCF